MLFLANPGGKKPRRKRKTTARRVARRRTSRAKTSASKGGVMAVRRRRKRRSVSAAPRRRPVRRRRRRSVAAVHANPVGHKVRRRRRHSAVARRGPVRRFRRNPDTARGIVGTLKQGMKDGALVLAGEVAQNKVTALADKFVPQFGTGMAAQMARVGLVNLGVASAIALGSRKFLPGYSRMVTAGAFSRSLANIIATTPAAPLLGDGVVYDEGMGDGSGVGAYAQVGAGGMGAYPSAATVDVPHAEH